MKCKWLALAVVPLAWLLYQLTWIPPTHNWGFDLANNRVVNLSSLAKVNFAIDISSRALSATPKLIPKSNQTTQLQSKSSSKISLQIFPANLRSSERIPQTWTVNFYSGETVTSTRRFSFPAAPIEIGDRFAIGTLETELYSLDLLDPNAKLQSFPSKFPFKVESWEGPLQLITTSETTFFRINETNTVVEVFAIDQHGKITLLANWPYRPSSLGDAVHQRDKIIYSLNPVTLAIEQHSAIDGTLLGNLQLAHTVDLTKMNWGFWLFYFRVVDQKSVRDFSLVTGGLRHVEPVNLITDNYVEGDRGLIWGHQRGNQKTIIWRSHDPLNVVSTLQTEYHPYAIGLVNSNECVLLGNRCGLSLDFYDLNSGKLIQRRTPLLWVIPLIATVVVYFLIWSTQWMRATAKIHDWPVLDQFLVSVIALTAVYLYGWSRERNVVHTLTTIAWSDYRSSFGAAFWLDLGLIHLAVCWLIFGKARWIWRTLPAVLLLCVFLLSSQLQLRNSPQLAWSTLYHVSTSVMILGGALAAMRFFGWRIKRRDATDSQLQPTNRTSFKLVDSFVLIAIVALLVSCIKPFHFPTPIYAFLLKNGALCGVMAIAAILLAFSNRTWMFFVGAGLMLITVGLLAGNHAFSFYSPFHTSFLNSTALLVGHSFVVPMFLALPYRFRGWRLSKLSRENRPSQPEA